MDDVHPLSVPGATITRQVLWLAAPVLVEQALLYLVMLSDTLLTGRYFAEEHLAAVTVATYLLWFLGSLLTVVSVGGTAPGGPVGWRSNPRPPRGSVSRRSRWRWSSEV